MINIDQNNINFTALEKLSKSSNRNLRNASSYALWQIKGSRHEDLPTRESLPNELPPTYEESIKEPKQATPNPTRLMLSYQWDSKPIARRIRDGLVDCGFTVWMDETHMSKASYYYNVHHNILKLGRGNESMKK